jgi:2-polyprenyl-3-methyl-5-hydroxy-6-metoxy-1,4-benzoquinol methylase
VSFYSKFSAYYEEIFPFSQNVADFLIRYGTGGNKYLDVGCGSGHYAAYLSAKGFHITGIDLDPAMIQYAQVHYPGVDFHCMDMRDISTLKACYDFVYCIGNTGAHLPQDAFADFTSDIRKILKPGGRWILQLMNWDYVITQDIVNFPIISTESTLTFNRTYTHITRNQVAFETVLRSPNATIFEDSVPLYPMLTEDINQLHARLGFIPAGHFGSYAGTEFNPAVFSASIYVFYVPG